ncbi:MAG: restriction endonuclease, partial [Actinomycetota bacterium]|nr:restriction endonuclease [Actinomycetota bacterium]
MMARQQKDSFDELMALLSDSPWWVSILVGAVVFFFAKFVLPAIWPDPKTISGLFAGMAAQFAWLAIIFVIPALISLFRSGAKRRRLDRQSGLESIRDLPWKQFEELLGEAYRRQGFTVFENPGKGADGGIDLTIKRGGERYLVQCKHWRTHKVGVKVVREMLGLVTAHGATGAIVVTSGVFTKEAVDFAAA